MRIDIDTFNEILVTITRNKTRSLLTAFGVFWGIFMLVVLLGGGKGFKALMSANFEGFAQNSAFIWPQQTGEAYKGFRKGRWWSMNQTDLERVRRIEGIDIVTCRHNRWNSSTAIYQEKKSDNPVVTGIYPDYDKIENQRVKRGRFINDIDILERRKVCFLGKRVADDLFGKEEEPVGKYIRVDGIYYRVVGVADGGNGNIQVGGHPDQAIAIPFTTYAATYNIGDDIGLMCLTLKPSYTMERCQKEIETAIKAHNLIHPDDTQAIQMMNASALFAMVDNLFLGINILIWLIGLGTLVSGVIGVSNIMMVTVKERTTEIGIRRAIGATPRIIMKQILTESIVLTLIAGAAGISVAVVVLQVMNMGMEAAGNPTGFQVEFYTGVGAAVLLMLLGIAAGIAPACRAMAIRPIEAIREE